MPPRRDNVQLLRRRRPPRLCPGKFIAGVKQTAWVCVSDQKLRDFAQHALKVFAELDGLHGLKNELAKRHENYNERAWADSTQRLALQNWARDELKRCRKSGWLASTHRGVTVVLAGTRLLDYRQSCDATSAIDESDTASNNTTHKKGHRS